jgi:cation diffusion facilitator family transporter
LLSAGANGHHHDELHAHDHAHHHDLNLRSAYLHVVADAATSVLAIAALIGGKYFGAAWLDPVMGIAGTVLVARWAFGLLRDTGRVLLDAEMDAPVVEEVREVVGSLPQPAILRDLHVWRVGKGKYACIVSLAAEVSLTAEDVRRRLAIHEELVHVTVEVSPLPS